MILDTILERRAKSMEAGGPWSHVTAANLFGESLETVSGIDIDEGTCFRSIAVFSAVQLLAETIGSLPLITYRRLQPAGKERVQAHTIYGLLHDSPNPEIPALTFIETLMGHVLTWGNAYAEISRSTAGRANGLWMLRPDRVEPERNAQTKAIQYRITGQNGGTTVVRAEDVLHIRGLGFDGLRGYSPISVARQGIGLGVAAERYGAAFFGNGARPGGVFVHPNKLDDAGRENLRRSWEEHHKGTDNAHKVGWLQEGITWQQIGIPPEDAQFLQTRQFQITEIARLFRIPPHMLGDLERATFSNIEHQGINFVTYSLVPWLKRFEQEFKRKLFPAEPEIFAEFLVSGLLRGDAAARSSYYRERFMIGTLSQNDIRAMENENPIENGDRYLVPLNMTSDPDDVADDTNSDAGDPPTIGPDARSRTGSPALEDVAAAFEPVWADAIGRVLRVEADKVRRAAKRDDGPERIDAFYRKHRNHVEREFLPALDGLADALAVILGGEVERSELASLLAGCAARHIELSRRQVLGVDPVGLDDVLTTWESIRPAIRATEEVRTVTESVRAIIERSNSDNGNN